MGVLLVIWMFRHVDTSRIVTLLGRLDGPVWLIAVPFALAQLTETWAWKTAFERMRCTVPLARLLQVRLACESITQTVPGGVLVAESIKPGLLMNQCGLTASQAICGTASRKLLVLFAHCGYFGLAAIFGVPALMSVARTNSSGWLLAAVVAAAFFVLLFSASGFALMFARGDLCQRAYALVARLPSLALRNWMSRRRGGFLQTDRNMVRFFELGPRRLARPTLLFLLAWCFEAFETWLILKLLGIDLGWRTICLIEVSASMLKSLAFVSPAGLGVQDLGYAGLLQLFGVPNALDTAATFILLKRSKELFWSLIGYTLLIAMRAPGRHLGTTLDPNVQLPDAIRWAAKVS